MPNTPSLSKKCLRKKGHLGGGQAGLSAGPSEASPGSLAALVLEAGRPLTEEQTEGALPTEGPPRPVGRALGAEACGPMDRHAVEPDTRPAAHPAEVPAALERARVAVQVGFINPGGFGRSLQAVAPGGLPHLNVGSTTTFARMPHCHAARSHRRSEAAKKCFISDQHDFKTNFYRI